MKFIFACGGTAGHVNPALAIAGRLKELMPESEFLFIGAEGKMEMELVPREGYKILPLKVTNLSRGKSLSAVGHNINTVKNLISSTHEAKKIIKDFRPEAVIGTGGYVCMPVLSAAASMGIATAVHESNAVPGLTTKLLAKKVDRVLLGLEDSRKYYEEPEKVFVTGTPVRGDFALYTKDSARAQLGYRDKKPLVCSVWGSLGAGFMNETLLEALPKMEGQQDFSLIHSVGKRYYADFTAAMKEKGIESGKCGADIREYIYDMPRVMAAADIVMCRAGASTLSELCYMGKPVIIVPSPNVTNNHQEKNARVLEKAGGAIVFTEGNFTSDTLLEALRDLIASPERLAAMSEAMRSLAVPDATDRICDIILEAVRKKQPRA